MSKTTSYVGINLTFEGDPFVFWEKLKEMKKYCEGNKIRFDAGQVTSMTQEG